MELTKLKIIAILRMEYSGASFDETIYGYYWYSIKSNIFLAFFELLSKFSLFLMMFVAKCKRVRNRSRV